MTSYHTSCRMYISIIYILVCIHAFNASCKRSIKFAQIRDMVCNYYAGITVITTQSLCSITSFTDWEKDPGRYCTQFWPGWDAKLTPEIKEKYQITGISKFIVTVDMIILALTDNGVLEVVSEHLKIKIFLGEHAPRPS